MKYFIQTAIFFTFLLLCFAQNIFACQCLVPKPDCALYQESDAIFVGEITKIIKPTEKELEEDTEDFPTQKIFFKVERSIKDVNANEIKLSTSYNTSCDFNDISVGQRWIVFAYRDKNNEMMFGRCSGSGKLDKKNPIHKVLEKYNFILEKSAIIGNIFDFISNPVENADVTVVDGENIIKEKVIGGRFKVDVSKLLKYRVIVTLPFKAEISYSTSRVKTLNQSSEKSVFEYEADLSNGGCSFNYLEYWKLKN
ncbi:MAG: hypothetical protein ACR2J3_09745 [Aridibacter sp.]